ncbi:hypothetical protein KM043_000385 [Ampulex compressa]|nr:hypothetical protein KM043_000385 [Ampulex compressa]
MAGDQRRSTFIRFPALFYFVSFGFLEGAKVNARTSERRIGGLTQTPSLSSNEKLHRYSDSGNATFPIGAKFRELEISFRAFCRTASRPPRSRRQSRAPAESEEGERNGVMGKYVASSLFFLPRRIVESGMKRLEDIRGAERWNGQ